MKRSLTMTSVLALVFGFGCAGFAAATLKVGDPAPKLQTGKWIQGEPVKAFDRDKAYIVEFWATWCGPCRASIPHLNEVYKKFKDKDLVVIGQNVWERQESEVAPFVKKMGEKMTYRVALDDKTSDKKGAMATTWMEAAGQDGIPAAFLVDKQGKIAWIGHPMSLKESTVEAVLAGTFDIKRAAAEQAKAKEQEEQISKLAQDMGREIQAKNWAKAEAALAELAKAMPEDGQANLEPARLKILLGKQDFPAAAKLAEKVGERFKDNAMAQNQLAWMLVTQEGVKGEALDTAANIARRANELSENKEPPVMDTLARALFLQGKKDEAIALQQKAIELASGDTKKQLEKTLESYKQGKAPAVED